MNYLLNLILNYCKEEKKSNVVIIAGWEKYYSIVYRKSHNQGSAKIEECLAKEPYLGWWQQTEALNSSPRINALSTSI